MSLTTATRRSTNTTTRPRGGGIRLILWFAIFFLLLLLQNSLLFVSAIGASRTLKQIHVVTRHGARFPLKKHSDTLIEEEGSSTDGETQLTPRGEQQMYNLGIWLKERYFNYQIFQTYDNNKVRMESSDFDRTLVSAMALSYGLFDDNARHGGENYLTIPRPNIPIYSVANKENDIWLRAYDKCPTFFEQLRILYTSKTWKQLERENKAFLQKLARTFPDDDIYVGKDAYLPLSEIWNVYDRIYVAKTECGISETTQSCKSIKDGIFLKTVLNDDDWKLLQDLAHTAELLKYSANHAQDLIGGNLVVEIVQRMLTETDTKNFFLYSAHYPTLLGVLAALQIPYDTISSAKLLNEVIPDYGSAIIFELWDRTSSTSNQQQHDYVVDIYYKPGGNNETSTVISLDRDFCGTNPTNSLEDSYCPLTDLVQYVNVNLESAYDWCTKCKNKNAAICTRQIIDEQSYCHDNNNRRTTLISIFVGLLVGAILTSILFYLRMRRGGFICCRNPQGDNNGGTANNNDKTINCTGEEEPSSSSLELTEMGADRAAGGGGVVEEPSSVLT